MKRFIIFLLTIALCLTLGSIDRIHAREKLAQTGMQFLSIGADSRAAGMGDAATTMELGSSSLFFNPAGMANLGTMMDVTFSQTSWIADINVNSFSGAFSPGEGKYGTFGFSVVSVDYGEVEGTMVWPNAQGYIDTEILKPSALAVGVGYARALSDKFSVGGNMKFVNEYLGESVVPVSDTTNEKKKNLADAVAVDFGTIFKTGFKSLTLGMSIRNFSNEIEYEDEGFQLPLTFKIGLSMDVLDFLEGEMYKDHSLYVGVDAVHPRAHSEQINIGTEYKFMEMIYLRSGYMSNNDEYGMTYGFGIKKFGIAVDYAYTPFGVFDDVQRFTFKFSF